MKGGKPYMKFGLEQMNDVIEKIASEKLSHLSNVIIGDNSSGKSLFLKKFIEKIGFGDELYFIDAVNRSFDVKKIAKSGIKPNYNMAILETRMNDAHFNLVDSFNCYGTQTECVEMIYHSYENKVQDLFFTLTNNKFSILDKEPLGEVDFGIGRGLLSSGYQAIIRILLELLYYHDVVISKQSLKKYWIIIDELDEFLSPKYSSEILGFLKEEFPDARWLITTHSCDLVANAKDANLIILDNSDCEVLDIDDYSSVSEVQIIFERLFGRKNIVENENDNILRRLLNNKINNAWGVCDDAYLDKILKENLSASQKIILKQIQEW